MKYVGSTFKIYAKFVYFSLISLLSPCIQTLSSFIFFGVIASVLVAILLTLDTTGSTFQKVNCLFFYWKSCGCISFYSKVKVKESFYCSPHPPHPLFLPEFIFCYSILHSSMLVTLNVIQFLALTTGHSYLPGSLPIILSVSSASDNPPWNYNCSIPWGSLIFLLQLFINNLSPPNILHKNTLSLCALLDKAHLM